MKRTAAKERGGSKKGSARNSLAVRICVLVTVFTASVLMSSMYFIYYQANRTAEREAMEKAQQALMAISLRMDNTLDGVQIAARNMHQYVEHHLDEPSIMDSLCRLLVATNPQIMGCSVAFEPDFYPRYGTYHEVRTFRSPEDSTLILTAVNRGSQPYTHQAWYYEAVHHGKHIWTDPYYYDVGSGDLRPVVSFSMPIRDALGATAGVMSVTIPMEWFSGVVLSMRPFPGSHAAVMSQDGKIVIHPEGTRLSHEAFFHGAFLDTSSDAHRTAIEMRSGLSGQSLVRIDGEPHYIFYSHYRRTDWNIAIVCPKDDITGGNSRLLHTMILISVTALLAILFFCIVFINSLLSPLQRLSDASLSMAEGRYDETVPETRRTDDVGYLQNTFRQMQLKLQTQMERLEGMAGNLSLRNHELQQAYRSASESDNMKDSVIRSISVRMSKNVKAISETADTLFEGIAALDAGSCRRMSEEIQSQTESATRMLDQLLEVADRKEAVL